MPQRDDICWQISSSLNESLDIFVSGSIPTKEQALEYMDRFKKRHKRKILPFGRFRGNKWTLPITFKFDGSHSKLGLIGVGVGASWALELGLRSHLRLQW